MRAENLGLIEYGLIVGLVLAIALLDLFYLRRSRRMRNGKSALTQPERNRSSDKLS
jgi:hypothetical protein